VDLVKLRAFLDRHRNRPAEPKTRPDDASTYSRRGLHYGSGLAEPHLEEDSRPRGALESYFDAHSEGPGLWKWRHYFPIYERHLGKFVGRSPSIIEIGILGGGSLEMWRHYFGEGTHVHGVDIQPACKAHEGTDVTVAIGDQSDPAFWRVFLESGVRFDIVIDDGGHEAFQQVPTLEALLPRLNPGGVYLCEDIHGPNHAFHDYIDGLSRNLHDMKGSLPNGECTPTPFQKTIDSIHRYPYVTVIEKRETRLDRLIAPKHGTLWEQY
jgi:hypothetical protein